MSKADFEKMVVQTKDYIKAGDIFQSVLSQELQRAGRFDRPLAVLMIDVDHLREINAKVHVMNELIDEACGRVLDRVAAAGVDYVAVVEHGGGVAGARVVHAAGRGP